MFGQMQFEKSCALKERENEDDEKNNVISSMKGQSNIIEAIAVELPSMSSQCASESVRYELSSFVRNAHKQDLEELESLLLSHENIKKMEGDVVSGMKKSFPRVSESKFLLAARDIIRIVRSQKNPSYEGSFDNDGYYLCKIERADIQSLNMGYINFKLLGGCRLRVVFIISKVLRTVFLLDFFVKSNTTNKQSREETNFFESCARNFRTGRTPEEIKKWER